MTSGAAGRAAHQGLTGRLVLFDLDGTLVDSTPGIRASVRVAAAELGRLGPGTARRARGMIPDDEWMTRVCRATGRARARS